MTVTDICNNALADLGHDRPIADLDDGSSEAARCKLFWPRARLAVLATHPWSFLSVSEPAVPVVLPARLVNPAFPNAYARPPELLSLTALDASGEPVAHRANANLILTADPAASFDVTYDNLDPDEWPAGVQEAVTAHLAFKLAGPLSGKESVIQLSAQRASAALNAARSLDARLAVSKPGTPDRYARARQS